MLFASKADECMFESYQGHFISNRAAMITLSKNFESWVSHEEALYRVGVVLGIFDEDSYESLEVAEILEGAPGWQHTILHNSLEDLLESRALQVNSEKQYKWCDPHETKSR